MQAQPNTTAEDLQRKYGMAIESRLEADSIHRRAKTIVFREPVTGDETRWVRPAVAVRRLLLPYCQVSEAGEEYLLNREYNPIWVRPLGGAPARCSTKRSMSGATVWFYNDGTPEAKRVAVGRRICKAWGIVLPTRLADLVVQA